MRLPAAPRPARFVAAALCLFSALAVASRPALAQGNLSTQGYGYPPGELSASSMMAGGAFAEFDPATPLNPAALAAWRSPGLNVHYNPEFRRVTASGVTERTTTSRFPLISAVLPAGRFTFGLSAATLLDRTWQTRTQSIRSVGAQAETASIAFGSAGGMSDVRLGGAYRLGTRLTVGAGVHVMVGQNRLTVRRTGGDTALSDAFSQSSRLEFDGSAVSAGLAWQPLAKLSLGMSGRLGTRIRAVQNDTVLARADVPNRFGAGAQFEAVPGVIVGAHLNWDQWSRLDGLLGSSGTRAVDAWDYAVGADANGPKFVGRVVRLRAGVRTRTLPFTAAGERVNELSYGGGVGIPVARGNASIDLGLLRAARSTASDAVREHAYQLSVGVTLRP